MNIGKYLDMFSKMKKNEKTKTKKQKRPFS